MLRLKCILFWTTSAFLWGCGSPTSFETIHFQLNDSTQAVFPVDRQPERWVLTNGAEALVLPKIDDAKFSVPVFNGSFQLTRDNQGHWTDSLRPNGPNGESYRVAFQIQSGTTQPSSDTISGTWDVWFEATPGDEAATAQLDLKTTAAGVSGTIRTPTGDYRYLNGSFRDQQLDLQTFDGAHLFAIHAKRDGNQWVNGSFYSGNHYHTFWSGVGAQPWPVHESTATFEVPLDSLYVRVVNRAGGLESLSLVPDTGQTRVVDILGSWCPNCMDEVRLLKELHEAYSTEIMSIAFERPEDLQQSFDRIDQFQSLMNIPWDIHLGGRASKSIAADAFPFLENVVSFPTTLFIQHDGTVTVHSGFNGPATGDRYEAEQATFKRLSQRSVTASLESR